MIFEGKTSGSSCNNKVEIVRPQCMKTHLTISRTFLFNFNTSVH